MSTVRRDFRRYLLGQVTATIGGVFTGTATSVVAVTALHASAAEVGVLSMAAAVPAVLLGPVAGVLADRTRRPRRQLIAGDLIAAAAIVATAVGLATGVVGIGWLIVFNVVCGLVTTLTHAVFFTHLSALGVGGLAQGRARLQAAEYFAGTIGAAGAAPAISAFGGPTAYLLDAVARLVSATALGRIEAPDHNPALDRPDAPGPSAGFLAALVEGVRVVWATPVIRALAGVALTSQVGYAAVLALNAFYALRTLGIPVALYGVPALCATGFGIGASLLAPRLLDAGWPPLRLLVVGFVGVGLAGIAAPLAPAMPVVAVVVLAVGSAAGSFFAALSNVGVVGVVTEQLDDRLFGRVSSTISTLVAISSALAGLLAGIVAESFGARTAVAAGAAVVLAGLVFLVPIARGVRLQGPTPATPETPTPTGVTT